MNATLHEPAVDRDQEPDPRDAEIAELTERLARPEEVSDSVMLAVDKDRVLVRPWLSDSKLTADSDLAVKAISINDDPMITDAQRERDLKALFREHGHAIKFTGPRRKEPRP